MNSLVLFVILPAALLVLIFLTGYSLSRRGKPYGMLLVTIHKLLSLGLVALLGLTVARAWPLSGAALGVTAAGAVLFLSLILSGGLLSSNAAAPPAVGWLHKIAPYLAGASAGAWLYLLRAAV